MTTFRQNRAHAHRSRDLARRQRRLARNDFLLAFLLALLVRPALAEETPMRQLDPVVVSASRAEQRRFDAPASVDAVSIDSLHAAQGLVNLSELTGAIPGVIARDRENYAQDLQLSVRGFGTRSTFGVRGVRILIDGIPATMPDGQGQVSNASLESAQRIEVLRGPLAQLYGNAAGGVVQVFTEDPPQDGVQARVTAGVGSDDQRQIGARLAGGSATLGGLIDVSGFATDGYRDHSAARRTQWNAKVVARPGAATTITGILNGFDQPEAEDPLGLTRAAFLSNPRQAIPAAFTFDTRKSVEQWQTGVLIEHKLSDKDVLNGRVYGGTRRLYQTLAFSGDAPSSSGGVVNLDRGYGGIGLSWSHRTRIHTMPLRWTLGVEADRMNDRRRGFVNDRGESGALRRDEDDTASNTDMFGQVEWTFSPQWSATAGLRTSTVRFRVDDHYLTAASPDDSGSVRFRNTSPVAGLVWHVREDLNVYANLGRGFETPTLAEIAYRATGSGPNFNLRASTSTQGEIGMKLRRERHTLNIAMFDARSKDEIVLQSNTGGRSVYQNADRVRRRGAELAWQAEWGVIATQIAYTWIDARFLQSFFNGSAAVASGNRLPGTPAHTLYADAEWRASPRLKIGAELRAQGKVYVDDINSDAAPGYTAMSLRAGYTLRAGSVPMFLFARVDNLFDRRYAGSVIVNESNGRFFEPAAGRRFFAGVRSRF